jgi:hypothetical protein
MVAVVFCKTFLIELHLLLPFSLLTKGKKRWSSEKTSLAQISLMSRASTK